MRQLHSERHDSFHQAVIAKREQIYRSYEGRRRKHWNPNQYDLIPPSSFKLAYFDASDRIRLEQEIDEITSRIRQSKFFIDEDLVNRLIHSEDQLDALMKRWDNRLPISRSLASGKAMLL